MKVTLPRMRTIAQDFSSERVDNIPAAIRATMGTIGLRETVKPGDTVAITAGSRGIANIPEILREVAAYFTGLGAKPFLVPAMGSHGGATAEGQVELLASLGITESSVGVPIRSSMETVVVAQTPQGIPVHFDRLASEAGHVFVVNRVKPHTRFVGPVESGLHKMMLIGLGKHVGAKTYHDAILSVSFPEIVETVADRVIESCRVCGGLAIVENARDETASLEAIRAADFRRREPEILKRAIASMPRLPFADVDLLIVDRIGKNISGCGMDANVVGRKFNDHAATPMDSARCLRIFIRGLTAETHGNALGLGMAEFTTRRVVETVDPIKTRINGLTSNHPEAAMIPITFDTDREAVEAALGTIGRRAPANARVIQIADTLHLTRVRVSEAYFEQVRDNPGLRFVDDSYEFPLDQYGWMTDVAVD